MARIALKDNTYCFTKIQTTKDGMIQLFKHYENRKEKYSIIKEGCKERGHLNLGDSVKNKIKERITQEQSDAAKIMKTHAKDRDREQMK